MPEEVAVSDIRDGMILARDAVAEDGNVLLAVGTPLQARHSAILERRGVATVLVAADADEAAADAADPLLAATGGGEAPADPAAAVRERLEHVFGEVRGDDRMELLLALALERADRISAEV